MRLARLFFSLSLSAVLTAGTAAGFAQSVDTAGLEVDVHDPSGALVGGSTLTLTNETTHDIRVGVSDSHGVFRFTALKPGGYTLTVERSGFATRKQTGITLAVGQGSTLNVGLTMANSDTVVQVDSDVSAIDPDRTSIGETISQVEIDNLPSDGRNFLDFAVTVPGVTDTQTTGQNSGFSVNGQRSRSNSIMIDGVENNGALNGNVRQTLSQDAIAQFQVLTEQMPAEFGGAGGGFVNVVTRGGTDNFHGTAYYFNRDNMFTTPNYFTSADPGTYSRNDVGATLGGPLKQNRTYFFGAAEYIGLNTSNRSNFCHLGTSGCTSTTYDTINTALATGFFINSPVKGLDFDRYIPKSSAQGLYSLRVDHRINDRNTIIARVLYVQYIQANSTNAGYYYDLSTATGTYTRTQNYFTEWTHIFTPRLINEAHFMVAPQRMKQLPNTYGPGADIAGSVYVGPTTDFPVTLNEDHYEADDALSYTIGKHLFKAGVQLNYIRANSNYQGGFSGFWNFYTSGNFASGIPYRYAQNFGTSDISLPDTQLGMYLEDSWKVSRRLTANLGVRYDIDFQPQGYNLDQSNPIQSGLSTGMNRDFNNVAPRVGLAYSLDSKGKTVLRAGYGMFYDKNLLILARNTLQSKKSLIYNYYNSSTATLDALWKSGSYAASANYPTGTGIAPTIQVAYPGLKIPMIHQFDIGIDRAITNKLILSVTGVHVQGQNLLKVSNANLNAPVILTPQNQGSFGFNPTYIPYVPGNTCLSPSSSNNGNTGRATYQPCPQQYNRPIYLDETDTATGDLIHKARINDAFNDITITGPWGHSNYSGLRVTLQQKSWHGLSYRVGYVYSKALDDAPDFLNGAYPNNPFDPRAEKSVSNEDVRHRFTSAVVWKIPYLTFRRHHNDWTRQIFGNWTVSGTYIANSGTPRNITVGSDMNYDGNTSTDRPFINGVMLGRNAGLPSMIASLNLRGQKEIRFRHGMRLSASAEVFNALNRVNFTGYDVTTGVYVYNTIPALNANSATSAASGRTVQLGGRFQF
ncbi:MAG: TonB-dependent receptor [Acidobacteriaceae bacterium]|nr:TonB-dependent receptor [Acidobacteriaceae bacterium]